MDLFNNCEPTVLKSEQLYMQVKKLSDKEVINSLSDNQF